MQGLGRKLRISRRFGFGNGLRNGKRFDLKLIDRQVVSWKFCRLKTVLQTQSILRTVTFFHLQNQEEFLYQQHKILQFLQKNSLYLQFLHLINDAPSPIYFLIGRSSMSYREGLQGRRNVKVFGEDQDKSTYLSGMHNLTSLNGL